MPRHSQAPHSVPGIANRRRLEGILETMPNPTRPTNLSVYTEKTLTALASQGLGQAISVGGALGLLHYLDYRSTHDVDAWWAASATAEELWKQRQQRAGSDADPHRARLAVETHLARISQHRPLEEIADLDQKGEAERLRSWFKEEFLHALLD